MIRQRGQTLVEFALMAPMIFLLIFGMIYGGAMFMEYLNFSNQARTIAREIAVLDNVNNRDSIIESYGATAQFTRFYNVERTISYTYEQKETKDDEGNTVYDGEGNTVYEDDTEKPVDVVVKVTFTRDNKDLPWVLYKVGFPPEKINAIEYTMRLERKPSNSE